MTNTFYKLSKQITACVAISTLACSAQAGFFDDVSNVIKGAQVINEVSEAVSNDSSASSEQSSQNASAQQTNVDLSKKSGCTNDMLWGVFAGYDKEYTGVDKGKSYKHRGFLNYVEGRGTSRCSLPELKSPRCLYFMTKKSSYINAGGKQLQMQCFYKDDPNTMITDKSLYPHNVNYFKPENIVIRCGNNAGMKFCKSGSAKVRAAQHRKNLSKHSAKDFSVCLPHGPKKREMYCQYVNPKTNMSLFKVEFTQTPK